jgi:hypothetical protein
MSSSIRTYEVALSLTVPDLGAGLQEPTAPTYARVVAEFREQDYARYGDGRCWSNVHEIRFPHALRGLELTRSVPIQTGWGDLHGWAVLERGRVAHSGRLYRDWWPYSSEGVDVEYDTNVDFVFHPGKLRWRADK